MKCWVGAAGSSSESGDGIQGRTRLPTLAIMDEFWVEMRDPTSVNSLENNHRRFPKSTSGFHVHVYLYTQVCQETL